MYTLYARTGACSKGINVLLRELDQKVEVVDASKVANFKSISPTGAVPALKDENGHILVEGVAIILHLLEKHKSTMLPSSLNEKTHFIRWLTFANATMHPSYSKLFFAASVIKDEAEKMHTLKVGAAKATEYWQIVENQLSKQAFFGGEKPNIIDIWLAVYAGWNVYFPVDIELGPKTKAMIAAVQALPSWIAATKSEQFA